VRNWNILLLTSLVLWVVSYNIWQFTDDSVYFIGTAQLVMVCSFIIHKRTAGINHIISRVFLFLSFNNLIDEIFFDPTRLELNEFTMFALFLIYSAWKWKNSSSSNGLN